MNSEHIQQRIEKDLPKLEARVAVVENRVSDLEKKQGLIDIVQRRVDHIEDNVSTISKKVDSLNQKLDESTNKMSVDIKAIAEKVDLFSDKIRNEFNRLIRWVAATIVLSLVSGIIIMFVHNANMFQNIGQCIGNLERSVSEKVNDVEKDVMRLEVKVDTVTRKK